VFNERFVFIQDHQSNVPGIFLLLLLLNSCSRRGRGFSGDSSTTRAQEALVLDQLVAPEYCGRRSEERPETDLKADGRRSHESLRRVE